MGLLAIGLSWAAAFVGYSKARAFVRDRLRYVDGVHRYTTPLKAGLVTTVIAAPIAWALPLLTGASAVLFGTAVGFGVAAGRRDLRRPASSYQ